LSSIRTENISALIDKRKRNTIIKEAIEEIKIVRNTIAQTICCILIASILSVLLVYNNSVVEVSRTLFSTVLDMDVAFFAVILGSYAVFQALMNDDILKHLLSVESNILKESNKTFLNLSILYIVDAFISFIAKMLSEIFTNDAYIYSAVVSNIIYTVFLIPYITFFLMLVLENINFVINLYRMFNVYTLYRSLDMLEDENEMKKDK
jgi:hypothetical protein